MTTLTTENVYQDEAKLKRMFSWLTKIGAGRKFGSLPIGWYQMHQCACIDRLAYFAAALPLRCKLGNIQAKRDGKWVTILSAVELFQWADNNVRTR